MPWSVVSDMFMSQSYILADEHSIKSFRIITVPLALTCAAAASRLRPRPQLEGQEWQVRSVWRGQLLVQDPGGDLQRRTVW